MTRSPNFAALFQASPYPYLLIAPDFTIIGANPAYLAATERTAEEIVGKDLFDAFPANPSDPDGTNLEEVRRSIDMAIRTCKPHTSALLRYAIPRSTSDGTVFEDRYWSAIHSPVFDDQGNVDFVAQNAIDVTELYRGNGVTASNAPDYGLNLVPEITGIDRPEMQPAVARILNVERAQLQSLFNLAPGFVAVSVGKSHVFQMVNDAYYQLIGYRDVIGKSLWDALPEVVGQGFEAIMGSVLESGQPLVLRSQKVSLQRKPNGPLEDRYLDLLYHPIRSPEGKVTGIFSQGYDVTEMREANRRLAEKIQELEAARARQAFQVQIVDRIRPLEDPDDVVAVASELLGTHLGVARVVYAVVDASGECANMKPDWTDGVLPSLAGLAVRLDDFGPLMVKAIRAGETLAIADVTTDERSAAHAHPYAVNGVRSFVGIPLMKAGRLRAILNLHDSRPRHWTEHEIALAQDMVDRTWSAVDSARAQADLRAERDQSRYIFDSMTEGFGLVDKNWTILQMNAEGLRISQRTAHEVIKKNHWDVWPELKGTPIEQVYRHVKATRKADIFDLPFTFPGSRNGWVEIRAYPSLDGGLAFFFRDVSERMASQEKLEDANRRKDEFLAMLAHELRNPLAPISAAAELLQMVKLGEERMRQTSQIIGRQVEHMTGLVDDLLDVSRVTRGLVELDAAPIDISHIITDAIEQATPLIRARKHHLGMRLASDATLVLADKKRLVQVLANLLSNAAKYTPDGGHILIKTEVRPAHVLIQVSDDGIGMAPDMVARAFDLFAQAERTSDRSSGGLGLGLALVKSLVEHHHGTVTCESLGLGFGSTFTICLPRLLADDCAKDAPLTVQQNSKALRIMVVDDNMDAAAMLAMLLEASGHKVQVEHGARRALERAKIDPPQVFLLDIGLPEMDGNELAKRLRAQPETANAVLIAITGYGQDSDRGCALAAGFDHHLVMPVDTAKLAAILLEAT
ncbi:PAS domain-containing protein [Noviherbaspirillum sp.]|uniref:PAS domain-containing protein n=1 Tax=Noviherbaspirillum sp. TaxID=1926288 RepID=UPI002FE05A44